MNIYFEWNEDGRRGGMSYRADVMIKDRTITDFKKWAKLFAKYATPEQHELFLSQIKAMYHGAYNELNLALSKKDDKGVKAAQKDMKFYNRKYEILQGLVS